MAAATSASAPAPAETVVESARTEPEPVEVGVTRGLPYVSAIRVKRSGVEAENVSLHGNKKYNILTLSSRDSKDKLGAAAL